MVIDHLRFRVDRVRKLLSTSRKEARELQTRPAVTYIWGLRLARPPVFPRALHMFQQPKNRLLRCKLRQSAPLSICPSDNPQALNPKPPCYMQLESQREHFERMMALSQSTSTALLADLRYMQAQVGGFVPGQRVEEPEEEKISEEEQNEFRQYLQKAGVKR